jgi:hypothetical protein
MAQETSNVPWRKLDDFVEAFETARGRADNVPLTDFLPESGHPLFRGVLSELVRVDLEYSWRGGNPKRIEDYQASTPQIFEDRRILEGIAFEEYRLRRQGGENPSPSEYKERFGVVIGFWCRPR